MCHPGLSWQIVSDEHHGDETPRPKPRDKMTSHSTFSPWSQSSYRTDSTQPSACRAMGEAFSVLSGAGKRFETGTGDAGALSPPSYRGHHRHQTCAVCRSVPSTTSGERNPGLNGILTQSSGSGSEAPVSVVGPRRRHVLGTCRLSPYQGSGRGPVRTHQPCVSPALLRLCGSLPLDSSAALRGRMMYTLDEHKRSRLWASALGRTLE